MNRMTISVDQLTKGQIAAELNKLEAELQKIEFQRMQLMNFLIAITQEPEAFKVNDVGKATIDREAVLRVKARTRMHIVRRGDVFVFTVQSAVDAPRIETPRIILPGGNGGI